MDGWSLLRVDYDKAYNYDHELRKFKDVFVVECLSTDAKLNVDKILDFTNQVVIKSDVWRN